MMVFGKQLPTIREIQGKFLEIYLNLKMLQLKLKIVQVFTVEPTSIIYEVNLINNKIGLYCKIFIRKLEHSFNFIYGLTYKNISLFRFILLKLIVRNSEKTLISHQVIRDYVHTKLYRDYFVFLSQKINFILSTLFQNHFKNIWLILHYANMK